MVRYFLFYLSLIVIVFLQMVLLFESSNHKVYKIIFINKNEFKNKLTYPEETNYKPNNIELLINKYKNTQYNFIYHLDKSYFEIWNDQIKLKLEI